MSDDPVLLAVRSDLKVEKLHSLDDENHVLSIDTNFDRWDRLANHEASERCRSISLGIVTTSASSQSDDIKSV